MPLERTYDLSQSQIDFHIIGGDVDQFHVMRYRGVEGLCQLFRFEIEVVSQQDDHDFDKIIGTQAVLHVDAGGGERWFHGVIGRFESIGQDADQAYFRIELVPWVWLLTHRYQSRVFQGKTVPEIIQQVLQDAAMPADWLDIQKLSGKYEPREYCVQYRETDYNFIARLMEAEGIWWYFEHSAEKHVLVLADAPSAYTAIEGNPSLPFHPPTGLNVETEHVFRFRRAHMVRPGKVTIDDFNFERPDLDLVTSHELGRDAGLEFSDYPCDFTTQARGSQLAEIRAQEFEAGRVIGVGQSNSYRLAPGRKFDLVGHPTHSHNDSYVVTAITYQGKQATALSTASYSGRSSLLDPAVSQSLISVRQSENGPLRALAEGLIQLAGRLALADPTAQRTVSAWLYHAGQVVRDAATAAQVLGDSPLSALSVPMLLGDPLGRNLIDLDAPPFECRFECIPASVTYRPPRVTPWPVMRGVQTARVVGPANEEIHTDKYGRVIVQFAWDRQGNYDEKSSCWIRVAQGMAGGAYGMLFLPRVGQEVIVDFIEGNPDRPIITGRVYNADHMPPYPLPEEKTKSVIKTHSSKGGGGTNEIRFEDLKDKEQLLIHAQRDFHLRVRNQERHNVGEQQHLTVEKEQRIRVGGHRSVDVGGKDALRVKETRNVIVEGDVLEDFKANHGHVVASQYYIKANQLVVEANSGISFKVGGNFIVIDSSGVSVKGTKIGLNSGGAALSKSVNGSPASPAAPEPADEVQPGQDKNYSGEPTQIAPIEEKPYEGHWISIDLKDESGNPVPGEYYEITKPNGDVISGTLDVNGYARVWVDEPGECQVTFPRRDAEEWEPG